MNKKIKEIIKNFDWIKVHGVMEHLNWKWVTSEMGEQIPSIGELVLKGITLLKKAEHLALANNCNIHVESGGFRARGIYINESDEVILELFFIIESWGE